MLQNKAKYLFSPPNSQNKEKGWIFVPFLVKLGITGIGLLLATTWLKKESKDFTMALMGGLVALCRGIFSIAVDLSSGMISKMLRPEWRIINDGFFSSGWVITRDVANLFIVLAIVAIALATILRFRDYEAKKLLPYLIAVALLVNFSGVLCGIIIDASNILMGGFNNGDYVAKTLYDALTISEKDNLQTIYNDSDNFLKYTFGATEYIFAYLILAFTFLTYSILLLVRYVMLGILYILSPMAFALWIFPKTRNLSTKWLTNFIQWAFFGAMAAFFIHLASQVLTTFTSSAGNLAILTVAILVFIGLRMSYKTSAIGAGAIIGLGAAAFTGGAALGWMGLKQMSGELGLKKLGNYTKERLTRMREYLPRALGGATPGTAAQQRKERFTVSNDDKKALDNATPDQLRALSRGSAYTQRAIAQQRYATEKMFETGKVASLPIAEQERIAKQAIANGSDSKELLKKTPYLAHINEGAVQAKEQEFRRKEEEWKKTAPAADKSFYDRNPQLLKAKLGTTKADAEAAVRASAYKKLNVASRRELPAYAWNTDLIENTSNKQLRETLKDLPDEQEKIANAIRDIKKKAKEAKSAGNKTRKLELKKLKDRLDLLLNV